MYYYNPAYENLLSSVLEFGRQKTDRTGTGTKSLWAPQIRYHLGMGFPLITTKKVHWKSIVIELLWLLRGETNIKFLKDYNVRIWDEWADKDGNLGPVYGKQWRDWEGPYIPKLDARLRIDQIAKVIERIKTNPDCRRLIVSAWNAGEIDQMALPPCHTLFQFEVYDGQLNCMLYQRSADMFLGVPFNIASYALLTHLIANECGLQVGEFVHNFGDAHIYNNHIDQVKQQLKNEPYSSPQVRINLPPGSLLSFIDECHKYPWKGESSPHFEISGITDFIQLIGYQSHDTIKAEVSV